ncbi:MAG: acyl-CoA thioesterase [Bacteroidetes bacterium]|nr:MAG: acyl-CoA thioesterase [Bacteroidota bacterium]
MSRYFHEHRVRYRECDPMGVVYHAHYIDYFEIARTEALRSQGISYKSLEDHGTIMPVLDLAVRYFSPARYDDLLEIQCDVTMSDSKVRVLFDYEVRRKGESEILVSGHVRLCFFDSARRRPIPAPDWVLASFPQKKSGE